MKILRLLLNLALLTAGAALGVVWGVHHPQEAADIARREQIAASKAKIEVLEKVGTAVPNSQQMIDDEKKKLADAQAQVQAQGN